MEGSLPAAAAMMSAEGSGRGVEGEWKVGGRGVGGGISRRNSWKEGRQHNGNSQRVCNDNSTHRSHEADDSATAREAERGLLPKAGGRHQVSLEYPPPIEPDFSFSGRRRRCVQTGPLGGPRFSPKGVQTPP
eukprot:9271938-Pyramimonas_sp.AAC.1